MVRYLRTGAYYQAVIFIPVGDDDMIFNGSLLYLRNNIFSFNNQIRLCKATLNVTHLSMEMSSNIARGIVNTIRLGLGVDTWCRRTGRLTWIKKSGPDFVIDLNQA